MNNDWYVQTYGIVIDEYEIKVERYIINQKIYRYEGKLYIETFQDGYRILFREFMS